MPIANNSHLQSSILVRSYVQTQLFMHRIAYTMFELTAQSFWRPRSEKGSLSQNTPGTPGLFRSLPPDSVCDTPRQEIRIQIVPWIDWRIHVVTDWSQPQVRHGKPRWLLGGELGYGYGSVEFPSSRKVGKVGNCRTFNSEISWSLTWVRLWLGRLLCFSRRHAYERRISKHPKQRNLHQRMDIRPIRSGKVVNWLAANLQIFIHWENVW